MRPASSRSSRTPKRWPSIRVPSIKKPGSISCHFRAVLYCGVQSASSGAISGSLGTTVLPTTRAFTNRVAAFGLGGC